jgi:hypothetical protein
LVVAAVIPGFGVVLEAVLLGAVAGCMLTGVAFAPDPLAEAAGCAAELVVELG